MRTIEEIFFDRTCYKFLNKAVDKVLLKEIFELAKLGPTSANSCPLRIIFIETKFEKEKLYNCLLPGNIEKTKSAPVTAVFAYDTKFYELMPKLLPHDPALIKYFSSSEIIALDTAVRNSTLQAAYFMIIARSKGLACGPMSGFNKDAVNQTFFHDSNYQVNYLCNLGYRDGDNSFSRLPRPDFDECCKIL